MLISVLCALGPGFQKDSSGISDHGLDQILEMGFSEQKRDTELKSDHVVPSYI